MGFLLVLFIVLIGGGWLLGKSIGNGLFPKEEDPMDYWKKYKEPPVINNHYHTHVHHHQNLTIIDDETKKKILEIKKSHSS